MKSSIYQLAVDKKGKPLPWYTYPAIDFLKNRFFSSCNVLEFGGGQSTLWWQSRAKYVLSFEENNDWHQKYKNKVQSNCDFLHLALSGPEETIKNIEQIILQNKVKKFDVIIIDGYYRKEVLHIASQYLEDDGMIICDNAEGYLIFEEFQNSTFLKVDFYGHAPGVYLPHSTSIYFRSNNKFFSSSIKISDPKLYS